MKKTIGCLILFLGLSLATVDGNEVKLYRIKDGPSVPDSGIANVQLHLLMGRVRTAFGYGSKLESEYRKLYDDSTYKLQLLKVKADVSPSCQALSTAKLTAQIGLFNLEVLQWYAGFFLKQTTELSAVFAVGLSADWKPNMKYFVRAQIGSDGVAIGVQAKISPNLAIRGGFESFPISIKDLDNPFNREVKQLEMLSLGCNYFF